MNSIKQQPEEILNNIFGYREYREYQREIIYNILNKKDTLAILPTGGGKSLCYQIPAIISDGLTIIISPLISLMKDQIEQLNELGIKAVVLNSSLSRKEYNENILSLRQGNIKMLYLAPETLLLQRTTALIKTLNVILITVDEAHCISEWGHEFRPEYRKLIEVKKYLPNAAWAAFTATATPRVQKDIAETLGFESKNVFIASFDRKNLFLDVVPKFSPLEQTLEFVKSFPNQPGIIYCLSRKQVDDLSTGLKEEGFKVKPYHAGLSDKERTENQNLFIKDDIDIIVATIAFGMGINKPDVRYILHYDLPKNIESYYQQIGRAGRDGLQSYCRLLFSYGDISKLKYFINQMSVPKEKKIAEIHLNAMIDFAEHGKCRRIPLINYFGEEYSVEKCGMCDNCTASIEDQTDITVASQKFMSCAARSGERFGCNHIIDILRASKAEKILKLKHNELSTYGIGKEFDHSQWILVVNELIRQSHITRDNNGVLKLNKSAWKVFRNEMKVYCAGIEKTERKTKKLNNNKDYDIILFEKLRYLRKELSDQKGIPPFAIFSNKSLIEMSRLYPLSLKSIRKIYGVGSLKTEKYGKVFLNIIYTYCSEKNISESSEISNSYSVVKRSKIKPKNKSDEIAKAFEVTGDVDKIARQLRIKPSTVIDSLYKYVRNGNPLENKNKLLEYVDLDLETIKTVFYFFEELGCNYLQPIHQEFESEVTYEDLKALRIVFMNQSSSGFSDEF